MLPFEHRALRNLAPKAPVGPKCAHNIHRGYSSPYKAPLTYPACIHKLAGDSRVGSGRDRRQRGEGGYLPGEHLPTDRRRYAQTGRPEFCMRLPPTRTLSLPLLLRIAHSSRRRPTRSLKTIVLPFSTRSFFTVFLCHVSVLVRKKPIKSQFRRERRGGIHSISRLSSRLRPPPLSSPDRANIFCV